MEKYIIRGFRGRFYGKRDSRRKRLCIHEKFGHGGKISIGVEEASLRRISGFKSRPPSLNASISILQPTKVEMVPSIRELNTSVLFYLLLRTSRKVNQENRKLFI